MRRRSLLLLVPTIALGSLLVAPARAADPVCKGTVTAVGPFYIDDRDFTEGGTWVYMESNSVPNLQAGGGKMSLVPAPVGGPDPCFPKEKNPDTLIF